jgi:sporulation related protein
MAIARQRYLMGDDTSSRGYGSGPGARSASGPSDPSGDPLTELARLIGQSDPYSVERQRGANPRVSDAHSQPVEWHLDSPSHNSRYPAPVPDAADDPAAGFSDEYGYDRPYEGQPYDEAAAEHGEEGQAYDSEPFGAYAGGDHDPHHAQPFYDDEAPAPRRRGWLLTATALVGLAVIGTAGSFAYRSVFTGHPPSIIARDPGPNKIIPANQTADRPAKRPDRIASGGQDERVISREEQPIVLPETARSAPSAGNAQSLGAVFPPPPAIAPAQPSPVPDIASPPGNTPGPRKIQTVTIKGDGSPDMAGPAAASAPAPAPVRSAAPPRPSAPATAAPAPAGPLSLTPQGVAQPAPAPAPAPARTSAISPPPQARAAETASGFFVQVTAQRSEAEAQSSYRGIQSKYANLLGSHQPVIRRKDLGSKGVFYGAQVGPLSHEAAVKLCEDLKSAGGSCMIQRN